MIRATMKGKLQQLQEGGMFSYASWNENFCVLSNIGLFIFDPVKTLQELPDFLLIHGLSVIKVPGGLHGQKKVFKIEYCNYEG